MVYTYTVIITAIHISRFLKKWHPYLHLRGICFASFPENLVMKAKKVRNQNMQTLDGIFLQHGLQLQ